MILLVEGVNCTGKSTLAENLRHHLEIPVIKFNVPGDDPFAEFSNRLEWAITHNTHFIIDRLHLSNYAYNGRLGGGVLTDSQWATIDQIIAGQKAFLYWMVDSPRAIAERLKERQGRDDGAERLGVREIGGLHNRFQTVYHRSLIPQKGSYTLTQFVEDGQTTAQFKQHLKLIKAVMAGIAF